MVRIENHRHMLGITCYVVILWVFLSFFGTFADKVDQTWFILHHIWNTTLFSIYYCFEVVRNENHNNMLEIKC